MCLVLLRFQHHRIWSLYETILRPLRAHPPHQHKKSHISNILLPRDFMFIYHKLYVSFSFFFYFFLRLRLMLLFPLLFMHILFFLCDTLIHPPIITTIFMNSRSQAPGIYVVYIMGLPWHLPKTCQRCMAQQRAILCSAPLPGKALKVWPVKRT